MSNNSHNSNLLFQSESHPLVAMKFETPEEYCLHLIHTKAYSFAAELADDKIVLDLGCNNGYGSKILNKRCKRVVGVDVSEKGIELARQLDSGEEIEFHVIDGNSLPFPDQTFDIVTSFQVIEHVSTVKTYLLEILRVLKPNGLALFSTPNREIRLDPEMTPWNPFHMREYNAEQLEETLARFFPEVKIKGLFADSDLYAVEFARVQAARNTARNKMKRGFKYMQYVQSLEISLRTMLINFIKAVFPDSTVRMIRKCVRNHQPEIPARNLKSKIELGPTLERRVGKWSLANLYYQDSNLNDALDLMALCWMTHKLKP